MPAFVFTGPNEGQYPGERDLASIPVGMVGPGDIRVLEAPLDHQWREATDEDLAALAARLAEPAETGGVEHPADGTLSPPVQNPAPQPVTAPPAVVPNTPAADAGAATQEG